ncbi:MAG: ankyrin repeat domain-containing protein [Crocinitomicaceae bacterium]|nr:ankyrin repeat domain-containing protein [Crocinitomicaceae bacterium]
MLCLAAHAENESAIGLLMKYGADPNVADNKDKYPKNYSQKESILMLLDSK